MDFSKKVKIRLIEINKPSVWLARRMGVNPNKLYKILNGYQNISPELKRKIQIILGMR